MWLSASDRTGEQGQNRKLGLIIKIARTMVSNSERREQRARRARGRERAGSCCCSFPSRARGCDISFRWFKVGKNALSV